MYVLSVCLFPLNETHDIVSTILDEPVVVDHFNVFRTWLISSHKLNQSGLPALTSSYKS